MTAQPLLLPPLGNNPTLSGFPSLYREKIRLNNFLVKCKNKVLWKNVFAPPSHAPFGWLNFGYWLLAVFLILLWLLTDFQNTQLTVLSHVFRILPFSMSVEFWEELKQFCDKWKKEFLENSCDIHICGPVAVESSG